MTGITCKKDVRFNMHVVVQNELSKGTTKSRAPPSTDTGSATVLRWLLTAYAAKCFI